MKEIHERLVAEVRKGRDPVTAAKAVGIAPDQAQVHADRWMGKTSVKEAIAAPEPEVKTPKPRQTVRRRTATKRKK